MSEHAASIPASDALYTGIEALIVRQKKEWAEIFTGFETANKYAVMTPDGQDLLFAGETSGVLARLFLKSRRPFSVQVLDLNGGLSVRIEAPFRFMFREAKVRDASGQLLGTVKQNFAMLKRRFSVTNAAGVEIFAIVSPLFKIWTFEIHQVDSKVGLIAKKWSGLGKEMFTDADIFNIEFPPGITPETKKILLGALFLIDMTYFEQK